MTVSLCDVLKVSCAHGDTSLHLARRLKPLTTEARTLCGLPTHTAVPKGVRVRQVRRRDVTVGFAVERLTGTVPVDLAGATNAALCAPLDTCGLAGTLTIIDLTRGKVTNTVKLGGKPWGAIAAPK